MRVKQPGQIFEGLWMLGTPESSVYLVEGADSFALVNAGLSHALPDYLEQLRSWGIEAEKIKHLVILHSHFDHVGMAPYLKRKFPFITLYASARAWELLARPRAAGVINEFMLKVCQRVKGSTEVLDDFDWQWRDDMQGEIVRQGSVIDLGGRTVQIYETPGHSSCSISAYVQEISALFPSDAVAIPYRDEYVIAAGSSFEKYQESLDKLAKLDAEIICADHYGYIMKDEAKRYIDESKKAARLMTARLADALKDGGELDQTAKRLVDVHFQLRPDYFVHPDILVGTYTQMLKQFSQDPSK
jgi:glyoxylase-like metal-dependent hydrolase (beta-lactamase superfamily II)